MTEETSTPIRFHQTGYQMTFAGEKRAEIHALMKCIGNGDKDSANQFLKVIDGWANKTAHRIARRIFGDDGVDEDLVKEYVQDALINLVVVQANNPNYYSGNPDSWAKFSVNFRNALRNKYEAAYMRQHHEAEMVARLAATAEASPIPTPDEAHFVNRRSQAVNNALEALPPFQRLILRLRANDESLEDIGAQNYPHRGLVKERIRQIENQAKDGIKRGHHTFELRSYLDYEGARRTVCSEDEIKR